MELSTFIETHMEAILKDWEEFAEQQNPASAGLSKKQLRNFAHAILQSVARDMRIDQDEEQRSHKSRGGHPVNQPCDVRNSAVNHATERLEQGFTLNQLASEYRALRASVIRRWRYESDSLNEESLEQLTRFNEAIDESLTESLRWYHARLQDARDLLNGVLAHDLRSPLGAILNSMESLLQDQTMDAKQLRIVIRVQSAASRMKSMISDLLDFTRTRLGSGLPIAISENNLGRIVEGVIEEQRAYHSDVRFDSHFSGDLNGLWDGTRMEQMIANLVDNAAQHAMENTPVTIRVHDLNGDVEVSIHNRGASIPEELQHVIFDPLRRAAVRGENERRGTGLGLGLYIARQIVEAHSGQIDVKSSDATGTNFTVRLPRRRKEGAEKAGLT